MTVNNNQETLVLFKNPKLYNGSRYKVYQTGINYDTWLTNNSSGTPLTLTINYQSISEPIPIRNSLPIMDEYTYGYVTNANKKYYIFIDDVTTDQFGVSTINFTVDWWATEWSNAQCTKAHLIRKPTKPGYMTQPYTPLTTSYSSSSLGGNDGTKGSIMFTYIPSINGVQSYISLGMLELTDRNIALVQNGFWYQSFRIAGADIKDCFIVPMVEPTDIATSDNTYEVFYLNSSESSSTGTIGSKLIDSFEQRFPDAVPEEVFPTVYEDGGTVYDEASGKYYELKYTPGTTVIWSANEISDPSTSYAFKKALISSYMVGHTHWAYDGYYISTNDTEIEAYSFDITGLNITSTETYVKGIQDWNSDIIWECPYGITVTSFNVRLLIGISHIMLEFIPNGSDKNGSKLTGAGFCYDCRHPGIFLDSYQDYVLKNRDYDIAMRQIQSEKQIWASVAGIGENIGFGMAFGKKEGAKAAGVGSVIETIGTYLINSTFDPKIQQQYDNRYQRMTDQISLVGDSVTDVYNEKENGLLQIYTLTMDSDTQDRMEDDITNNGYYCDETVTNLSSLFTNQVTVGDINTNPVFMADSVVVEGAVPLTCKQQIVYRLQNGVEFI